MRNTKLFVQLFFIILGVSLASCGSGVTETPPSYTAATPINQALLSDFTLANNYDYWEIQAGPLSGSVGTTSTVYSFDQITHKTLSLAQINLLSLASSPVGFSIACRPSACPIYGVAIAGTASTLITSKPELLTFFNAIDTPAELNVWLWAHNYGLSSYTKTSTGYNAIVNWNSLSGTRGQDLIAVDPQGNINKISTISSETGGPVV